MPLLTLSCQKTASGDVVWQKDFKNDFGGPMMSGWDYSESPTIDGDKLICTPGGDKAAVMAFDKMSGTVLWASEIPNTGGAGYATVAIADVGGKRQYITLLGSGKGLVGVDAETGKFLWNYKKVANGTANIPTAVVKGDFVFTSTEHIRELSRHFDNNLIRNARIQPNEAADYIRALMPEVR